MEITISWSFMIYIPTISRTFLWYSMCFVQVRVPTTISSWAAEMQACTRPRSFLAAWHDVFWIPRWLIHPSQNGSRLPGESRLRFRTGSKQYKMVVVEKNETHWFIQFTLHITQKKMLHLKPTWFAQFFYSTYVILVLSMKPMEPICFGEHPSLIYPHIQTWESLSINTLSYSLSALWNKIPMKKTYHVYRCI